MMSRTLTPETWLLVFQHMSKLPFCHPTIDDPPALEGQADLLNCVKVCKAWNVLASPSLYRIPIVHSLRLFIFGIDRQPAGGLPSKTQNLQRVERLFLEYDQKREYLDSFSDAEVAEYATEVESTDLVRCKMELAMMKTVEENLEAWNIVLDRPIHYFPQIRTLSTNAVGGAHANEEWPAATRSAKWSRLLNDSQHLLHDFIFYTSVRHFCQSGRLGHLSLNNDYTYHAQAKALVTISTHSSISVPILSPTCNGLPFRWYIHAYEEDSQVNYMDDDFIYQDVEKEIRHHFHSRRAQAVDGLAAKASFRSFDMTGGIYMSVPDVPVGHQRRAELEAWSRKWAAQKEKDMEAVIASEQWGLPADMTVSDAFEIKAAHEAPICDACGWDGKDVGRQAGWRESVEAYFELS